ncbi:adenosylcobinamide amidohydrolase [Nonomuraea antimicrobica]
MISSALLGGGIGAREWVLNAQVVAGYTRMDPVDHLVSLGPARGDGVGMMTAASVDRYVRATDGGVEAVATVGLRVPTWAAVPEGYEDPELAPIRVGTINIVVVVPVAMTDAALVNTVMTVTEAKSQAMIEAGFAGTGTASDAVCVAAPAEGARGVRRAPLGVGRPDRASRPRGGAPGSRGVAASSLKVREFGEVACGRRRDSRY